MKPTLLVAVLLAGALAGCVADDPASGTDAAINPTTGRPILPPELRANLTEAIYEIEGHYEATFTGQTGIQLYVDWYLPDVPEGQKVPTILVFTPYQSGNPEEGGVEPAGTPADGLLADTPYWSGLMEEYVSYGYAVAFADVRGTHRAGGCTDQTGPDQWTDGYDYVEFLAAQEWSNGKVGMYGVSYDGETQTTTAIRQPPSLATIVPVAAVSNQYEWLIYDGVPLEGNPLLGMVGYLAGSAAPSFEPGDLLLYPEKFECQDESLAAGLDWSGDYTEFWERIDYRPYADQIQVPTLLVQGFDDHVVRSHQATPFFHDIEAPKRAILGQWGHAVPDREDWGDILHAWYDHHLLDIENGIMDILPPVLAEDSQQRWWGFDDYPVMEPEWLELELSPDMTLVAPGNGAAGELTIHDYPTEYFLSTGVTEAPVQTVGTGATGHGTHAVWTFTLPEDRVLYGRPELTFTATSSAESTHWVALLGNETTGDCRDSGAPYVGCVDFSYKDTRHRHGIDQPEPLTPGEPYELRMVFSSQFEVLPAGETHTLVLTNNNPDVQQDPTNSQNTIHLGGDTPAVLRIPLMPAGVALPADELPAIYPGYLPEA